MFLVGKKMTNDEFKDFFAAQWSRLDRDGMSSDPVPSTQTNVADAPAGGLETPLASELAPTRPSLHRRRLEELRATKLATEGAAILTTGQWSAPKFPPVPLAGGIDWEANPIESRTWLWMLHQFHFLLPLVAHAVTSNEWRAIELGMELIRSWARRYLDERANTTAWHDHGTAMRARHVLTFRQYLLDHAPASIEHLAFLDQFLKTHVEVLAKDSFYSRSTNHGLDQSLVLLELVMELGLENARGDVLDIAMSRVRHEVGYAFAKDGGHVENSPAYLRYGLHQALEAANTGRFYFGQTCSIGLDKDRLDRAIQALAFMIRPDRILPLIGDTSYFVVHDFLSSTESPSYPLFRYAVTAGKNGTPFAEQSLFLPESGWAVMRAHAESPATYGASLHLVMKCGFLSTYHRHDDDLSFVLFAFGEDWLIDGGLYKHEPKDPLRIYARSADAHNISMPFRARATRSLRDVDDTWGIVDSSDDGAVCRVTGANRMFTGYSSRRELALNRSSLSIDIRDFIRCESESVRAQMCERMQRRETTHVSRFLCPNDKHVRIDRAGQLVRVFGKRYVMTIRSKKPVSKIVLHSGRSEPTPCGWASIKSGVMEPAHAIEFHHSATDLDADFGIQFSDRSTQEADHA